MIKHVFVFEPAMNMVLFDRWYFRFHSKEVPRASGPWLRRYETFRSYPTPPEADRFGAKHGRLTELWYSSVDDFKEADPNRQSYTPPPGGWAAALGGAITMVPARPTEDFRGKSLTPEEVPILRWYQVIKYPDGVSRADGEKWYLNVFSQEARKQAGLLRFVSHTVLDDPPIVTPWHRVTEMWYEDFSAWRKAVIESPPHYTRPPWGKSEPFVDMVSTFVGTKPDVDFLKDSPLIP